MQVKEILRVKGNRLITAEPGSRAVDAVKTMAEQNLGSLVVLDQGRMAGMLPSTNCSRRWPSAVARSATSR